MAACFPDSIRGTAASRPTFENDPPMQRWLKLPDGRIIDANRIAYIGKVETYARIDEDGTDLGTGYAVYLGTDFPREAQISVMGSRDEVLGVLRALVGPSAAAGAGPAPAGT